MIKLSLYNFILAICFVSVALVVVSSFAVYRNDPLSNMRVILEDQIVSGSDFNANYFAAKRYFTSDSLYRSDKQESNFSKELLMGGGKSRFVYYPFSALFFVPFTLLSFDNAYFLLTVINILLLLISLLILTSFVKKQTSFFLTISVLLLFSPILWTILERGQTDIIIFFFLTLCLYFFLNNKKKLSGISLVFASMFKLTPLFLVPYFYIKNKIIFYSFLISFVFFIIILGTNRILDFISAIGHFSSNHSSSYLSTGIFGLFYNNITEKMVPSNLAHLVYIVIIVPIVLAFFYFSYKKFLNRNDQYSKLVGFSMFLSVMILLPQVSWLQHCIHLLFIVTAYWIMREKIDFNKRIIAMDFLIVLIFSAPMLLLVFQDLPLLIIFALRPLYVVLLVCIFWSLYSKLDKENIIPTINSESFLKQIV